MLDAGTGCYRLGEALSDVRRLDILLTHLHMDHILGLGFFAPMFCRDLEVHIWGPQSTTLDLRSRLSRYLSPPLFPVRLEEFQCQLTLHDVVQIERFRVGELDIQVAPVIHPGPTVGYRISEGSVSMAYVPDHEPVLGGASIGSDPQWISGWSLASGVDLLLHDAQYTSEEYLSHVGWGHSALEHVLQLARLAGVHTLVPFHHDPGHTDDMLDRIFAQCADGADLPFGLVPAREGLRFDLDPCRRDSTWLRVTAPSHVVSEVARRPKADTRAGAKVTCEAGRRVPR
jgi:ribonuclease BN (tRNA processing enzyme)